MSEAEATTVLVIDDEQVIRDSISEYLEDRDYHVLTAENGAVGIDLFEKERPNLVLTDLRMPTVDGLDVLRRVGEVAPDVPLIVVSGTGRINDSVQALRLGAWDYILKPVKDMSIITHAVERALERARLLRENRAYQENLEALVRERTAELRRVNTHLQSVNRRLRDVVESMRVLSRGSTLADYGSALLREFAKQMSASGGSLFLLEEDSLRLLHTLEPGHVPEKIPLPLREGSVLKRVIEGGEPLLIADIMQVSGVNGSGWDGYQDSSALAFPLSDGTGRTVGAITLHGKTPPPFTEQDKEIGAILASYSSETLRAVRAGETLRASETRFRELAEMLPAAIFEAGADLKITYGNRRAYELFGYSPEDLAAGIYCFQLLASEERGRAERNLRCRVSGDELGVVEYRALRKDGETFPVLFHAVTIVDDGEVVGLRGAVIDITERKMAEEALRQEKEFTETALNSQHDTFFLFEPKTGKAIRWNRAFSELTGYSDEEIAEMKAPVSYYDEDDLRRADVFVDNVLRTGIGTIELDLICKDGRRVPTEYSVSVVTDGGGGHEYLISVGRDITERKSAEEARARLEEQYRQAQKMEAVGRLAGGVAHDFNNMLGGILGYAELALKRLPPEHHAHAYCEQIRKGAERSADLTQQLLAFARKQAVMPKTLDLNESVDDMLKMLRRLIGENVSLTFLPAPDLWPVKLDPGQVSQIVANLCVNARDAITGIGHVTIKTGHAALDDAYCTRNAEATPGEYVFLAVSDDGCGMDGDVLAKAFEPFFTTKAVGEGTGLGLATVYGIVKQNRGSVEVESEPGEGAKFTVFFPRYTGKTTEEEELDGGVKDVQGHELILVVEDEPMILDVSREVLKDLGYDVLCAATPAEAIELAEKKGDEIDLLLTDIVMPDMSGPDLAKRLLAEYPGMKCLFMSGYTANMTGPHGILGEGTHFIQKPITTAGLAKKVREALAG